MGSNPHCAVQESSLRVDEKNNYAYIFARWIAFEKKANKVKRNDATFGTPKPLVHLCSNHVKLINNNNKKKIAKMFVQFCKKKIIEQLSLFHRKKYYKVFN